MQTHNQVLCHPTCRQPNQTQETSLSSFVIYFSYENHTRKNNKSSNLAHKIHNFHTKLPQYKLCKNHACIICINAYIKYLHIQLFIIDISSNVHACIYNKSAKRILFSTFSLLLLCHL